MMGESVKKGLQPPEIGTMQPRFVEAGIRGQAWRRKTGFEMAGSTKSK